MKFAFLGYGQECYEAMSQCDQAAMVEECFAYDHKLLKDGHLIDAGACLQPAPSAKVLRWRDGAVLVTDGPYAETKEQLGGIGVLEARDILHAVELLARHPGLRYGATFEVRPIDEAIGDHKLACLEQCRHNAAAVDAHARKFACIGHVDENNLCAYSHDERHAMLERCTAFDVERFKNGQWLSFVALQSARTAKTLRAKVGRVVVTDGPYAETKECMGGLVVLALKDMDTAVALLSTHPALLRGVTMEIRPIHEEISKVWEARAEGDVSA